MGRVRGIVGGFISIAGGRITFPGEPATQIAISMRCVIANASATGFHR
jgi:hypothetical protein